MNVVVAFVTAPGVEPGLGLFLIAASFATSLLTAALSLGGGVLMIALLSFIWPAAVAVPIHGIIQLGSNAGRALHRFADVQWRYAGWFVAGAVVGTAAGGPVAAGLPDNVFRLIIGAFLVYAAWGPRPRRRITAPAAIAAAGTVTSALGMVVGASGPLVAGLLRGIEERRQLVGTHAALMTAQHTLKIAMFGALGFQFAPYLPLTAAMIASGFIGTLTGGRLLDHLPEAVFRLAFRIVLTVIAVDLVRRGLTG